MTLFLVLINGYMKLLLKVYLKKYCQVRVHDPCIKIINYLVTRLEMNMIIQACVFLGAFEKIVKLYDKDLSTT